jgi:hypothetical protein
MRRAVRVVAFLAAFFLMAEAGAQDVCVALPPKEWTGTVAVGTGGWVTQSFFEHAACNWNGAEGLNGFDAYVMDISEYAGLPLSIETTAAASGVQPFLSGLFLNGECQRAGFFGTTDRGAPATASVPLEAKWIVIFPSAGASQVGLKITSPGRTCTAPKPVKKPPKKKKPRNR